MSTPLFIREPQVGAGSIASTTNTLLFSGVTEATLVEELTYSVDLVNTQAGVIKTFLQHGIDVFNLPLIYVAAPGASARASGRVAINIPIPVGWSFGFYHDLIVSVPGDAILTVCALGGIVR